MRDPKAVETLAGWFELMHSVKRAVDSRKLKPEVGIEIVEECRDLLQHYTSDRSDVVSRASMEALRSIQRRKVVATAEERQQPAEEADVQPGQI